MKHEGSHLPGRTSRRSAGPSICSGLDASWRATNTSPACFLLFRTFLWPVELLNVEFSASLTTAHRAFGEEVDELHGLTSAVWGDWMREGAGREW